MATTEERISSVATEIRELSPVFSALVERINDISSDPKISELEGRERAETLLPCEISGEALKRCKILVTNNLFFLETLGVISLTRYVFELLIRLRTIQATPLKSLHFMMEVLTDSEAHTSQHITQLEAEARFFDEMALRDDPTASTQALIQEHGDKLTPDIVRAAEQARMAAIDFEARRHFIAYGDEVKDIGYSYQAHLIRTQAVVKATAVLEDQQKVRGEFIDRYTQALIDEPGQQVKWNWLNAARAVGMEAEYRYIYAYTSRLLHATPTSFYTNSKNLEPAEMRLFLEYVYVRMLDVIDVVSEIIASVESRFSEAAA